MGAISGTSWKRQVDVHYVNAGVPGIVEENFDGLYLEHVDIPLEEVLQQESVYLSLQTSNGSDRAKASGSADSHLGHGQSGGERQAAVTKGESSHVRSGSQLLSDEDLARDLQELEYQLTAVSVSGTSGTQAVNREINAMDTSALALRQDNIDPDNMTYEELQSLGEAIGTESKGLSDELISYLPSFKYKTGLFSKKDRHEECVICSMEYKNRDKLTTLPCQHQYHSKCITPWLKIKKVCPVCKDEVFGP